MSIYLVTLYLLSGLVRSHLSFLTQASREVANFIDKIITLTPKFATQISPVLNFRGKILTTPTSIKNIYRKKIDKEKVWWGGSGWENDHSGSWDTTVKIFQNSNQNTFENQWSISKSKTMLSNFVKYFINHLPPNIYRNPADQLPKGNESSNRLL